MDERRPMLRAVLAGAALAALVCALPPPDAAARTFRQLAPLARPSGGAGGEPTAILQPVDPALVRQAVEAVAAAWNTGQLSELLAPEFFDRHRLLDTIAEVVPRDARLRVLAVSGISTLEQTLEPAGEGEAGELRVSTVSAIVDLQVEFSDPQTGFQVLRGRNEFLFRVTERIGR